MASSDDVPPSVDILRASRIGPIADIDPGDTPGFDGGKAAGKAIRKARGEVLADLQERLYAHGRSGDPRSVLVVLQGWTPRARAGSSGT